MRNNMRNAIKQKATEQHDSATNKDDGIEKNVSKIIEETTNQVYTHILKGNEIKLLSYSENEYKDNDKGSEKSNKLVTSAKQLENLSIAARNISKLFPTH